VEDEDTQVDWDGHEGVCGKMGKGKGIGKV
jgi:hypothetical protein